MLSHNILVNLRTTLTIMRRSVIAWYLFAILWLLQFFYMYQGSQAYGYLKQSIRLRSQLPGFACVETYGNREKPTFKSDRHTCSYDSRTTRLRTVRNPHPYFGSFGYDSCACLGIDAVVSMFISPTLCFHDLLQLELDRNTYKFLTPRCWCNI